MTAPHSRIRVIGMRELQDLVSNSPLMVPILIMLAVAPIGFIDAFYFHIVKFKLYRQPSARAETITHIIRSLLFGTGALLLLKFQPHGWWVWVIGGLFIIDFIDTIVDVLIEPSSRKPLGGLPPAEYLVHIIGAVAAGAISSAYFIQAWPLLSREAALIPLEGIPWWISIPVMGLVLGSFSLGLFELFLLCRFNKKSH